MAKRCRLRPHPSSPRASAAGESGSGWMKCADGRERRTEDAVVLWPWDCSLLRLETRFHAGGQDVENRSKTASGISLSGLVLRPIPPAEQILQAKKMPQNFRGDCPLAMVFSSTCAKNSGSGLLAQAGYLALTRPNPKSCARVRHHRKCRDTERTRQREKRLSFLAVHFATARIAGLDMARGVCASVGLFLMNLTDHHTFALQTQPAAD